MLPERSSKISDVWDFEQALNFNFNSTSDGPICSVYSRLWVERHNSRHKNKYLHSLSAKNELRLEISNG